MLPALFVKLPEAFDASEQRALQSLLFRLPTAPSPEFVDLGIQEDGRQVFGCYQLDIRFLNESSSAQGDYFFGAASQFLQQFFQGLMLGATKSRFSGIPEDFRYFLLFALLNPVVKILKAPAHVLGQNWPNTAFSGAHESDQNYGLHLRRSAGHIGPVKRQMKPYNFGRLRDAALADSVFSLFVLGAFSEMNFTTEGSQNYGG
jgi:hypothetical protein